VGHGGVQGVCNSPPSPEHAALVEKILESVGLGSAWSNQPRFGKYEKWEDDFKEHREAREEVKIPGMVDNFPKKT